jgi:hypothetical protein
VRRARHQRRRERDAQAKRHCEGGGEATTSLRVQGSDSRLLAILAHDSAGAARETRHAAHTIGVCSAVVRVPRLSGAAMERTPQDANKQHAGNHAHRGSGSGGVPVTMGLKMKGSASATIANGSSRHPEPTASARNTAAIALS